MLTDLIETLNQMPVFKKSENLNYLLLYLKSTKLKISSINTVIYRSYCRLITKSHFSVSQFNQDLIKVAILAHASLVTVT